MTENKKEKQVIIILAVIIVIMLALYIVFQITINSNKSSFGLKKVKKVSSQVEEVTCEHDLDSFTVNFGSLNTGSTDNESDNNTSDTNESEDADESDDADSSDGSEYIFVNSDTEELTRSDLEKLSKKELRYARNELYARHGYIFDDSELSNYFNSKSWYDPSVPSSDFKDVDEFNSVEIANRNLIKEVENSKN